MRFRRLLLNRREYDSQSNLAPWALHCVTAWSSVRSAVAWYGTLADGSTILPAVVVAARCVADRSRDAWWTTDRSEEGCLLAAWQTTVHSFGVVMLVSNDVTPFWIVTDNPTPFGRHRQITPCGIRAGCPLLM